MNAKKTAFVINTNAITKSKNIFKKFLKMEIHRRLLNVYGDAAPSFSTETENGRTC